MPFVNKKVKTILFSLILILCLSSCSSYHKIPLDIGGESNDFESLISTLTKKVTPKLKNILYKNEIVFVSDFVNLKNLDNKSQLGFLLSDLLKNEISSLNIIIKEVEFRKNFTLGQNGFKALSRNKNKVLNSTENQIRYAFIGNYTITKQSLFLTLKIIDITTGNILASSTERTPIDNEILQLEEKEEKLIIRPNLTL